MLRTPSCLETSGRCSRLVNDTTTTNTALRALVCMPVQEKVRILMEKEYIYCRYLFPREMRSFNDELKGCILEDPHRPDLRNLFLNRNDCLINSFEEHLLLMNLGNIDWRPLLNLWTVLEYLTKCTAKAGKGFEDSRETL